MAASSPNPLQPYFKDIVNVHASISMTIAGCVLLVYDWLLTLDQEVDFLRYNRKRVFKFLYIINRYTLPFVLIVTLSLMFFSNSRQFCEFSLMTDSWFTLLSYSFIHGTILMHTSTIDAQLIIPGIIAMRLWALYGRKRWLLALLVPTFIAYFLATATLLGFATSHMLPRITTQRLIFHSCITELPSWMWAIWLPGFLYETLLFGLLVERARRDFKRSRALTHAPPLLICLYRDGLLYYVTVTGTSFFTMMVWAFAPHSLIFLSKYFSLCAVNVAASRLVLQLNSQSRTPRAPVPSTTLTQVGPQFIDAERYHARTGYTDVHFATSHDYYSEIALSKLSERSLATDTLRSVEQFE
ncbi:hypothetical protein AURDEDRAFT_180564 [Auricularia subglabra TFB-10046 SS5]|nr:hypothetical protein AURDEDRAFT_180564 [Auricularia subglabra TFB-10046 SS5]